MKLKYFISGSSVILMGWLAATFVYRAPSQRDQKPPIMRTVEVQSEQVAPNAQSTETAAGSLILSATH